MTTMAPEVEEEASGMEDILQVFRIFKLARVLKLARHSPGKDSPNSNSSSYHNKILFSIYLFIIHRNAMRTSENNVLCLGLQAIAYTLQNSYKELGLLIFLICISGFIFASLAYFIEIEEDSGFTSIPTAFYWVVITMTTIGYGDIFPVTGE